VQGTRKDGLPRYNRVDNFCGVSTGLNNFGFALFSLMATTINTLWRYEMNECMLRRARFHAKPNNLLESFGEFVSFKSGFRDKYINTINEILKQNFFLLADGKPALLIMTECGSFMQNDWVVTQEMIGLYELPWAEGNYVLFDCYNTWCQYQLRFKYTKDPYEPMIYKPDYQIHWCVFPG